MLLADMHVVPMVVVLCTKIINDEMHVKCDCYTMAGQLNCE